MQWIMLILAGLLEVTWACAMWTGFGIVGLKLLAKDCAKKKPQGRYLRFSFPQSQSLSRTFTRECPRSVREYSTFGGIWG